MFSKRNQSLMLAVIAVKPLILPDTVANSQNRRTAWEYTLISASREFETNQQHQVLAGEWTLYQDDKQLPAKITFMQKLAELGSQGWELVSVCDRSSVATSTLNGYSAPAGTSLGGFSIGGATTDEFWTFKRPSLEL